MVEFHYWVLLHYDLFVFPLNINIHIILSNAKLVHRILMGWDKRLNIGQFSHIIICKFLPPKYS